MKKYPLSILFLILTITFVHAEGANERQSQEQHDGSPVSRMDTAVRVLAGSLNKKLIEEKAGKIAMGQFAYRGNTVPLTFYWINQLTEELTNIPNRPYIILSGGPAGADWTISGEIIEIPDAIRLYTRLVRTADRAIEASFHSDLERNEQMLSSGESRSGRSSPVAMDSLEPDSFDNPVPYEIGADNSAQTANRTLHDGDEDFFLLIPETDKQLVAETTGNVDTFMELYNADTTEKLAQNDDSGSGYNARIRYNVRAGKRYIA